MSETQSLWLVLALIYAIECIAWLRRDSLGFRTWLSPTFRPVRPAQVAGNHRGGFVPVHPLPPLGTLLVAHPLPFAAASEGLLAEGRVVSWDAAQRLYVSNLHLRLEGVALCRCGSNAHAAALASEFKALAALPSEERVRALREWHQRSLEVGAVEARLKDLAAGTRRLRGLCIGLWAFVFLFAPAAVYWRGLAHTWWWLVPALFGFTSLIAATFRTEHKRRHPGAEDERFSLFLTFLLSPASAIRAVDALSRAQLAQFNPLAVARVVCSEADFRALAGQAVREVRFRPAPRLTGVAAEIQRAAGESWCEVLAEWLRGQGVDPEQAVVAPAQLDPADRGYCPRCQTRFTRATGECGDCGGVPLKPLK